MKLILLFIFSGLYCIGHVNAQKIASEKEKNNAPSFLKKTYTDTLANALSQIKISQNGGDNRIMIKQNGLEKENSLGVNYTEVYENGTNKIVISSYILPDSVNAANTMIRQSRVNNSAKVIQHGKGNSVSISQSPAKIE